MMRCDAWCSGEDCEFGHDIKGNPYVRMVLYGGRSIWFPLHEAAKKWGRERHLAQIRYMATVSRAEEQDQDGEDGPQARDAEGFLMEPREDDVPWLEDTDGDEDDQNEEGEEENEEVV